MRERPQNRATRDRTGNVRTVSSLPRRHKANLLLPRCAIQHMTDPLVPTGLIAKRDAIAGEIERCTLPLTSARAVDLVVTELAVISFAEGHARLVETAPGVTVEQVIANTEASLVVSERVPHMAL